MEEMNENIFTGYCKVGTNHCLELNLFCKTHNELCCEKCISKNEEKEVGQHKHCDTCPLETIKGEKENSYKTNMKHLKNISSNFEKTINELKKLIDNANEEKEKIKLNIQKLFTKLRNALNNREDELFIAIDNIFENIKKNEMLAKESEKLLSKSKLLLKVGETSENNEWNNSKKLGSLIYVTITLENTIKGINSIKENINKSSKETNLEINFEQNIDIDKFIESFKNIGILKNRESINNEKDKNNILQIQPSVPSWKQVDGKLMQISGGIYGIWGVNSSNYIYYRNMISNNNPGGINWIQLDGLLKHISSGESGIWGVNSNDEIFYRKGISNTNPTGNEWGKIDGSLKQVSSGKYGVYGVNYNDEIWFRSGINNSHLGGVKWISIDGRLKYISAGNFGVWGVNSNNEVFLRKGVNIYNPTGNGWIKFEGNFKKVCCGEYYVLAIDNNNEVFYRKGVSQSCFEGESWEKFNISFKHISDGFGGIWGIDNNDDIYYKI